MSSKSFYGLHISALQQQLRVNNFKDIHAKSIFTAIYKDGCRSFEQIKNLPGHLINFLEKNYSLALPIIDKAQVSDDQVTIKLLVKLDDGSKVECVLVPFNKKYTVCISSQVGCAMKCSFCYTGTQGLTRNLKAHEVISQYMLAFNWIKKNFPHKNASPNIVFMGQGEPLHNFKNIKDAINILLTTEGLYLGPRQVTLSTAGYLPGIKRFSELNSINFALSFHSPFDEQRNELIPLNKAYPISELLNEVKKIPRLKRQYLTFEYLLIKGLNHHLSHLNEIERLLKGWPVIFNIIPFNPFPGSKYQRPSKMDVDTFVQGLEQRGFHVMVRTTKGDDILAACGQLNT